MISREKYLARQRRYNRSPKGRIRNDRGNAKRLFAGMTYLGTENAFARAGHSREAVEEHLGKLYWDFRHRQMEELRADRERINAMDLTTLRKSVAESALIAEYAKP